jgi:hypothetical protein
MGTLFRLRYYLLWLKKKPSTVSFISVDPLAESTTTPNSAGFESSSNDLLIQGLGFTEETLRQPSRVRITAGSSLDIQCGVTGYPYPDLIWLKVTSGSLSL